MASSDTLEPEVKFEASVSFDPNEMVSFMPTLRGGRYLLFDGYKFVVNRKTDSSTFWRCIDKKMCSATIVTSNETDEIQRVNVVHCHEPHQIKIEVEKKVRQLKEAVRQNVSLPVKRLYKEALLGEQEDMPDDVFSAMPTFEKLKTTLYRERHKLIPTVPRRQNRESTIIFKSPTPRVEKVKGFKLALIQLAVGASKGDNITRAVAMIKQAAAAGANLVALPECFNSPYGTNYFPEYAEPIPGPSTDALAKAAKENSVFLIGGSIPEKCPDGTLYNTSTVYNPKGDMIAVHRKIHLFDIDVPGKIRFQESEVLSPGSSLTCFKTPYCDVGVGICYDIRFAELAQLYAKRGCKLIVYPGAFNMTTGPAHWEPLQKGRALDNQLYVATVSPARDESASYVAWGHSTVVSPWGEVIAKADHEEKIVYADIDMNHVEEVRTMVPLRNQRRHDLYKVVDITALQKSGKK